MHFTVLDGACFESFAEETVWRQYSAATLYSRINKLCIRVVAFKTQLKRNKIWDLFVCYSTISLRRWANVIWGKHQESDECCIIDLPNKIRGTRNWYILSHLYFLVQNSSKTVKWVGLGSVQNLWGSTKHLLFERWPASTPKLIN